MSRLPLIDRRDCRRRVEERFSAGQMVRSHERLYLELLSSRPQAGGEVRLSPIVPPAA